jgi:hypothetical protein
MDKPAIHHAIVAEIVKALEGIRPPVVPPKLLDVIASWGDTLDDAERFGDDAVKVEGSLEVRKVRGLDVLFVVLRAESK